MKNKTGKYIKYALGEIILVVIGILIALQINNWNEEQKANKELNQYLITIKSDIANDRIVLDSLIKRRALVVSSCKSEQLNFLNKTYDFMTTRYAMRSYWDFYFTSNTSGYESLKNSPYLGRINGSILNSLLVNYNDKIASIAQKEKSYNEFVEALEVKLAYDQDRSLIMAYIFTNPDELKATKTTQQKIEDVFKKLHESAAFRNIVSQGLRQETIIEDYVALQNLGLKINDEINKITND